MRFGPLNVETLTPDFASAAKKALAAEPGLDSGTVAKARIYTALDLDVQNCATSAVSVGLPEIEKNIPGNGQGGAPLQAAMVAILPQSGYAVAWVGGRDRQSPAIDRVSELRRTRGSWLRTFIFLTALDPPIGTYPTASMISLIGSGNVAADPESAEDTAQNVAQTEGGSGGSATAQDVTLRAAIENSLDGPAIYVTKRVGIETVNKTVTAFGIGEKPTLLELTSAYAALANKGNRTKPLLFAQADLGEKTRVKLAPVSTRAANQDAVYLLNTALQGVTNRGNGQLLRQSGYQGTAAVAGAVSFDMRDSQLFSYTPALTVGVWIGYDDGRVLPNATEFMAAPIWTNFMQCMSSIATELPFEQPESIEIAAIDTVSGKRATRRCPQSQVIQEAFVRGTLPGETCEIHRGGAYQSPNQRYSPGQQRSQYEPSGRQQNPERREQGQRQRRSNRNPNGIDILVNELGRGLQNLIR